MFDYQFLIENGGVEKKVPAETTIIEEDYPSYFYYQLIEGRLRAVSINENGKEFIHYIVHPGETFAEIPLVTDYNFQLTVISDISSTFIKLPKEKFYELTLNDESILMKLCKVMAERLRLKYLITKDSITNNPKQRVLSLLNYFKENGKNICHICNKVELTRKQIAEMLGFRVETVIRVMRDLNDKGLIEIKGGKVFLKD
jgi:CRP-like cAMP-binding protein